MRAGRALGRDGGCDSGRGWGMRLWTWRRDVKGTRWGDVGKAGEGEVDEATEGDVMGRDQGNVIRDVIRDLIRDAIRDVIRDMIRGRDQGCGPGIRGMMGVVIQGT